MGTPLFEAKGLTKDYQGVRVLDIPHLSIEKGKVYSLVGPNGAGKTTLLRILATLESPTSGEVFYKGESVGRNFLFPRRKVTMVMQNPFLFKTTVCKNLSYGLRVRRLDKEEIGRRVESALQRVGLSGFEKRHSSSLSVGQVRRVAIARALVLNPEVLLLDEPTANLDEESSNSVKRIIREVGEKETTVILATPDFEQAHSLGGEVIPLVEGKIAQSPIDNLLSGELVNQDGEKWLLLDGDARMVVSTEKEGRVCASIDPKEIIVSPQPFQSSARNCFRGRVVRAAEENLLVRLWVDAGLRFVVVVTKSSFNELNLNLGSEVYLTFKASSVKIY